MLFQIKKLWSLWWKKKTVSFVNEVKPKSINTVDYDFYQVQKYWIFFGFSLFRFMIIILKQRESSWTTHIRGKIHNMPWH